MEHLASYIIGFLITIALVWGLQPIARFFNLVDKPGGRKKHSGNIPIIGGIAMYIGLVITLSTVGEPPLQSLMGLLMGGGLLLLVGTIDDIRALSPYTRFLTQITAALLMVLNGDVILSDMGMIAGGEKLELGMMAVPLTVFATVGVINAMNMSDGMDGLAGGMATITLLGIGILAGGSNFFYLYPAIICVILAFLYFNLRTPWRSKAKIFMGDGGSMFLGFVIAWSLIQLSQGESAAFSPVIALWLFALPLLDTVCIMLRRIIKGRSPFAPDREHFHHILLLANYTPAQAVWIMLALAASMASIGLAGFYAGVSETSMFIGFLVMFGLYFWGMSHAWKLMKTLSRRRGFQSRSSNSASSKISD